MEKEGLLANELYQCVVDGRDAKSTLSILKCNNTVVKEQGWQILASIVEDIGDADLSNQGKTTLSIILNYLVDHGNAKEVLFSLLEACQAFRSTSLFLLVLPGLTQTVLHLPLRQLSLDIILETVSSHIKGISWLEDYYLTVTNTEGVDQLVANDQGAISELLYCSKSIIMELVVPVWEGFSSQCTTAHRELFINFLLKLFHYPLLYIHMNNHSVSDCCSAILELIQQLIPTFSTLLEDRTDSQSTHFTTDQISQEPAKCALVETTTNPGIGNLCYMVFFENSTINYFPCVFTNIHRLSMLLPFLNSLYSLSSNPVVLNKTQRLIQFLISSVPDSSMDGDMSCSLHFRSFVSYSHWCMQYCDLSPLRKTASDLLKLFHQKLTPKCRFQIYNWILETEKSPDVLGYTYTQIKDLIHSTWQNDRRNAGELEKYAIRLISVIYRPPDIEAKNGNLLEDLSRIASALNLALYLVLRDKKRSSPYTQNMSKYIREYVEPVGVCIESELTKLRSYLATLDTESPSEVRQLAACSLTVGGETLTNNSQLEREGMKAAVAKLELVLYNHTFLKQTLQSP